MARNVMDDIIGKKPAQEPASSATPPTEVVQPTPPVVEQPAQPQAEVKTEEVKTEEIVPQPQEPVISAEKKAEFDNQMKADLNKSLMEKPRLDYDAMIQRVDAENRAKRNAELEARRRKSKQLINIISDGLSAMSNLYFTTKGAPSVQYDPRASLSARSQARWDEIDKTRNAEAEKQYLRDKEKREEENRLALQRYNRARQSRIDRENREYRDNQLAQQEQYRQDQLALQKYRADLDAELKRESFIANAEKEATKQNAITYRTLHKSGSGGKSGNTPMYLGNGEVISIPSKALSEQKNISAIYNALPDEYKKAAFDKFNLGKYTDKEQLTPTQMNQIIGEYIEADGAEDARKVLRSLADGEDVTKSKSNQKGLGWSKSNNDNKINW